VRLPQVNGSKNSRRIERRRKEKQKVGTSEFLREGGGGNNIVSWTDVGSKDPLTYVFVAKYVEQFLDLYLLHQHNSEFKLIHSFMYTNAVILQCNYIQPHRLVSLSPGSTVNNYHNLLARQTTNSTVCSIFWYGMMLS
jgi:hypothetical protein